jgi:hypothetical protein
MAPGTGCAGLGSPPLPVAHARAPLPTSSCILLIFPVYPGGGPGTRSSQFLVVIKPNVWNGGPKNEHGGVMGGERHDAPVGQVVEGMETVFDRLYQGYGDLPEPKCAHGKCKNDPENTPDQTKIFNEGTEYIHKSFPKVTFIRSCSIVEG